MQRGASHHINASISISNLSNRIPHTSARPLQHEIASFFLSPRLPVLVAKALPPASTLHRMASGSGSILCGAAAQREHGVGEFPRALCAKRQEIRPGGSQNTRAGVCV